MIILNFKRSFLSLALFFIPFNAAIAASSYDFFKDSSLRIHEASEVVRKCNMQQAGSLDADAATVVLFLEKMRTCYYEHLDHIEAALPYWKWAKDHPYRYTASQFPHKWLKHGANQAEVEHIYATICALREACSKEFGMIVRLLGTWHEGGIDMTQWLDEVKNAAISMIPGTKIDDVQNIEQLIQKLSVHEQDVAKMVERVQQPQWLKRNWIPVLATTAVAGAAAYAYMQNKTAVDTFCVNGVEKAQISFMESFYIPVKSFVTRIFGKDEDKKIVLSTDAPYDIKIPVGLADEKGNPIIAEVTMTREAVLKEYNDAQADVKSNMQAFKKSTEDLQSRKIAIENKDTHWAVQKTYGWTVEPYLNQVTQFVQDVKDDASKGLQHLAEAAERSRGSANMLVQVAEQDKTRMMNDATRVMNDLMRMKSEKIDFLVELACLMPAYWFATKVYGGVKGTFNWFTKRDRTVLIDRLCEVQEVLIHNTHNSELADAEYGRMLYLLTKAYDQVARNVFSNERTKFLKDLTYIADTQSSIEQKQKTLDAMWRKYQSLASSYA